MFLKIATECAEGFPKLLFLETVKETSDSAASQGRTTAGKIEEIFNGKMSIGQNVPLKSKGYQDLVNTVKSVYNVLRRDRKKSTL